MTLIITFRGRSTTATVAGVCLHTHCSSHGGARGGAGAMNWCHYLLMIGCNIYAPKGKKIKETACLR
jgi:hypothetical protein